MRPVVVKIGGSLAEAGRLGPVLRIMARARRRVVVVPGGGAYADAVREAQRREHFPDAEAHRQALLAMHRMASDMVELQPELWPAASLSEIGWTWTRGRLPVWLPLRLCARDGRIPADWSITSDGLAARLAERLGRCPVVLVKSVCTARSASAASLARQGVIDPAFAAIVRRSGLYWRLVGLGQEAELRRLVATRAGPPRPSLRRT